MPCSSGRYARRSFVSNIAVLCLLYCYAIAAWSTVAEVAPDHSAFKPDNGMKASRIRHLFGDHLAAEIDPDDMLTVAGYSGGDGTVSAVPASLEEGPMPSSDMLQYLVQTRVDADNEKLQEHLKKAAKGNIPLYQAEVSLSLSFPPDIMPSTSIHGTLNLIY